MFQGNDKFIYKSTNKKPLATSYRYNIQFVCDTERPKQRFTVCMFKFVLQYLQADSSQLN